MNQHPVFHQGELEVQRRLGVAEQVDRFGQLMVRDHLPEQHRNFYQQLPMIFVAHTDDQGWPWASVLCGKPGFISSDHPKHLQINALPVTGDPLQTALQQEKHLRLGLLGLELQSRRRNRMSGQLRKLDSSGFQLDVLSSFGNCPKYIQSRQPFKISPVGGGVSGFCTFDQSLSEIIKASDTFFVASSNMKPQQKNAHNLRDGADISHRGGKAGFIKVLDSQTLLIPDFSGNNLFNTLGNFQINPQAGLLFIDFQTGDLFSMTGKAEVLWNDPRVDQFYGAKQLWQFTLHKGVKLEAALSLGWQLESRSPALQGTGVWSETD